MTEYNSSDLLKFYKELQKDREKSLKDIWIKLPSLYRWDWYVLDTLVLIYFHQRIGKVVTKEELTKYLKFYKPWINDVQQARHLAQQKWWYIISWQRWDIECKEKWVKPWEYMLVSIELPYPWFILNRRTNLSDMDFNEIKKVYNYRCATCWSKEWEENFMYRWTITKLEKWHIDPLLDLTPNNTIPQCDKCNKAYRGYFRFDKRGRVEAITDPSIILKSDENIQKDVFLILKKKFM
jgi:hypothetical protein